MQRRWYLVAIVVVIALVNLLSRKRRRWLGGLRQTLCALLFTPRPASMRNMKVLQWLLL